MGFCKGCLAQARKAKDYLNSDDRQVVPVEQCVVHPVTTNWRFWRALKRVQYWGSQPDGFRDSRCPTPITLGEGWVHRRNAELILFHYEKYFLDLAIKENLLEQESRDGVSRAIRLTQTGNVLLFEEVKKGTENK